MAQTHDHHAREEAQRILNRVDNQEGSLLGATAARLDSHLKAADAPQDDKIELWGVRIGRTIALGVTLLVIAYALTWLFSR